MKPEHPPSHAPTAAGTAAPGALPRAVAPQIVSAAKRLQNLRQDLGLEAAPNEVLGGELFTIVRNILPAALAQRLSAPIFVGATGDGGQAISLEFRDSTGRYLLPSPRAFAIQERQAESQDGGGYARKGKAVTTATLVRNSLPEDEAFESVGDRVEVLVIDDRALSGELKVHYLFHDTKLPPELLQNTVQPGSGSVRAPEVAPPEPEIASLLLHRRPAPQAVPAYAAETGNAAFSLGRELLSPLLQKRLETLGVPAELASKVKFRSVTLESADSGVFQVNHRIPYFTDRSTQNETVRTRFQIDPATGRLVAALIP